MKYRITSMLLVFTIFFCMFTGFSVFANTTYPSGTVDYRNTQELVDTVTGKKVLDKRSTDIVSRADFVTAILKLMDIKPGAYSESAYKDVPVGMEGADYILTAADMGYVSKTDRFHPYHPITVNEAMKISVAALGYVMQADMYGGYPYGYMMVAKDIGLLYNINASDQLTVENMYDIFYNILHARRLVQSTYGDMNDYTTSPNILMYDIYEVRQITGVVTATPYNSVTTVDSKLSDNRISVNGEIILYENPNPEFLGMNCKVYCKKVEGQGEKAIYVEPYKNYEAELNLKDIDILDDSILTDEGKYRLKDGCIVFLNGKLEKSKVLSDYKNVQGSVRIIDNNEDGYYDYAFVKNVSYMIIGNVNAESQQIIDRYGYTVCDLSDDDCKYIVKDYNSGEILELGNLTRGDCVAVFASSDKKLVTLIKCGSSITGKVSEINKEDNQLLIDENTYVISDYFKKNCSGILANGLSGNFYVGIYNDIVDILPDDSDFKYGYLLTTAGAKSQVDSSCRMKIFTQDGIISVFPVANKPWINGTRITVKFSEYLKNSSDFAGEQLIRYKLVKGEIAYIDTAVTSTVDNPVPYSSSRDEKDSLTEYSFDQYIYRTTGKCFAPYFTVEKSVVFYIPSSMDEEKFRVTNYNVFLTSKNYTTDGDTIIPYDIDETGNAGAVVFKDTYSKLSYSETDSFIVDKIGKRLDENGNEVFYVKLWFNGVLNDYNVPQESILYKESGKMISKGDIVTVYSVENEIFKITVDFDSDPLVFAPASDAKFNTDQQYSRVMYSTGRAFSAGSSYLVLAYANAKENNVSYNPDNLRTYYYNAAALNNIYVFDREEDTIKQGTIDDIIPYIGYRNDSSFVVLRQSYGTVYSTLVFK